MKKSKTKEKIIDTMMELISEQGYEKASIGNICKAIGVSKPAVYYYFTSKEEIFVEVARRTYMVDYSPAVAKITVARTSDEYKAAVVAFGVNQFTSWKKHPNLRKVSAEINLNVSRIPALEEIRTSYETMILNVFKTILTHGASIGVLKDNFNVQLNTENLYATHMSLAMVALYGIRIQGEAIWQLNVENMLNA